MQRDRRRSDRQHDGELPEEEGPRLADAVLDREEHHGGEHGQRLERHRHTEADQDSPHGAQPAGGSAETETSKTARNVSPGSTTGHASCVSASVAAVIGSIATKSASAGE